MKLCQTLYGAKITMISKSDKQTKKKKRMERRSVRGTKNTVGEEESLPVL
jgi:hypothetical protein